MTGLYVVYVVFYTVCSPPLFDNGWLIWLFGLTFPITLFVLYGLFEEYQKINRVSVHTKVMGRWFFLCWAMISLPCGVGINSAVLAPVYWACMLLLPPIFWFLGYFYMNTVKQLVAPDEYRWLRERNRDFFSTINSLNWDDPDPAIRESLANR